MAKTDPLILHIESSTTVCSVALSKGLDVLGIQEVNQGYTHAENLLLFIKNLCETSHLRLSDLDAVSVSKGPGSYTGLRIGVAAAKGICYATGNPLIAVDTLESMAAYEIQKQGKDAFYCPMIDARRMEVYCSIFDNKGIQVKRDFAEVLSSESFEDYTGKDIYLFGDGALKATQILTDERFVFIPESLPSATKLIPIAMEKFKQNAFENIAYFEPFYLKEFIAGAGKKS